MRYDIKTWLGVGPIVLWRGNRGAAFNFRQERGVRIIFDYRNQGIINGNGEDITSLKGCWLEFSLVLTDAPAEFGGEGQDNLLELLGMLNDMIAADVEDQYLYIQPARSDVTPASYAVKIIGEVNVVDLGGAGEGQGFSLTFRTRDRLSAIPTSSSEGIDSGLPLLSIDFG